MTFVIYLLYIMISLYGAVIKMYFHPLYVFLIWLAIVQRYSFCITDTTDTYIEELLKQNNETPWDYNDADLNITQLATKYGYQIEQHTATTKDGYILNIYRLPPRTNVSKKNIVVFLMHGVLDSSDSWILLGPNYALGYILADEGFDVWMGNARGNKYSSSHALLPANSSEYWKFSWDEIGFYDLPTMIDYTLNETGSNKLYYIGHSQGTTTFYVMNSLLPEYNSKVEIMFSLSPVSWMSHAKSPVLKLFTPTFGIFSYLTSNSFVYYYSTISSFFCKYFTTSCDNIIQLIIGHDYKYIDTSFLKVIFGHISGTSIRQFIHYGQLHKSGKFCRYDYGEVENLSKYNNKIPPDYDLSRINVPIVLFYSDNDFLSDTVDVNILKNKLPNVIKTYNLEKFNHFDYMYAKTAKDLVYFKIIKDIRDNECKKQIK